MPSGASGLTFSFNDLVGFLLHPAIVSKTWKNFKIMDGVRAVTATATATATGKMTATATATATTTARETQALNGDMPVTTWVLVMAPAVQDVDMTLASKATMLANMPVMETEASDDYVAVTTRVLTMRSGVQDGH